MLQLALEKMTTVGSQRLQLIQIAQEETGADEKRVLVESLRTILTAGLCLSDIKRLDRVITVHFPGKK